MNDQPQTSVDTQETAYANSAFGQSIISADDPVATDKQGLPLNQNAPLEGNAALDLSNEEDVKKLYAALTAIGNVQLMNEADFASTLRDQLNLQATEEKNETPLSEELENTGTVTTADENTELGTQVL